MFTYSQSELAFDPATLTGYTQKTFNTEKDFLAWVSKIWLDNAHTNEELDSDDIDEFRDMYNRDGYISSEELANAYRLWENLDCQAIQFVTSDNAGDGNPMEFLYLVCDLNTKEYTIVSCRGTYSSWADHYWYELAQVNMNVITAYQFQNVSYP